jgi:hypothetical protein
MKLDQNTILIVLAVALVLYLVCKNNDSHVVKNDGKVDHDKKVDHKKAVQFKDLHKSVDPNRLPKSSEHSTEDAFTSLRTGKVIEDKHLLAPQDTVGVDTVGSSLRNGNRQFRSDPIIKQENISPWNRSTIDPNLWQRPLNVEDCKVYKEGLGPAHEN